MEPARNPFSPGAGVPPPELAGRDQILADALVALERVKLGRPAKSQMLLGLRGVGKTVLLNRIARAADEQRYQVVELEVPEGRTIAELLVPEFRRLLVRLSVNERVRNIARRALGVLRAFAATFRVSAGEVDFGVAPEPGTADSGDLESDLTELFRAVALAAQAAHAPVAIFLDEVQYLSAADLGALIVAIHKLGQRGLPLIVFGAGLPQLAGLAGESKSYAERLFDYPNVGALAPLAAAAAIRKPLADERVAIDDEALRLIVEKTQGYPYFLQEWGHHVWLVAKTSPVTLRDAVLATDEAIARLDTSFFRVRFDRLTPREKDYVRAMAELGAGPHRSGEIARVLNVDVTAMGRRRDGLIKKGMIYAPQHGETAFTVPLFDEFMLRTLPSWSAPSPLRTLPENTSVEPRGPRSRPPPRRSREPKPK